MTDRGIHFARAKCLCPTRGKWRGWSSLCPIHGCPKKATAE